MKILAIRYGGMGDIIMLLPTLEKIKQQYAKASLTLLCDEVNAGLQKISCGVIDDVITIDREAFRQRQIGKMLKDIGRLLRLWREFDIVYDFQSFGETALISYLLGKKRIGAVKKAKYAKYYTSLRPYDTKQHRSRHFAQIADVDICEKRPKLCVHKKSRYAQCIDPDKKSVGLNIGSTQESRRWSERNFSAVASYYFQKGCNVLVFFGPKEKKFANLFPDEVIKVVDVDLEELAATIALCDIVISNDTGPVHMAAALDVPTLTLFSTGTDWQVGCLNAKKRFIKKANINAITVEEVIEESEKLLYAS